MIEERRYVSSVCLCCGYKTHFVPPLTESEVDILVDEPCANCGVVIHLTSSLEIEG